MNPFFSIVTPTLQRDSLRRTCESIDAQTFQSWEHIVIVDAEGIDANRNIFGSPTRKRWVMECGVRHNNFGNTCRHNAWAETTGSYLIYCDDDNYFAHPNVLTDIYTELGLLDNDYDWALFPIHRHGFVFLMDPPGMCMTDTANMVIKREFARWPDTPVREADGMLAEKLKASHPYVAFPNCPPIIIMEKSSNGL